MNKRVLAICPNPSIDVFATVPQINLGKANRIQKLKEYPGGKGVHVALALAELSVPVSLMASWAGNAGAWIKRNCESVGIPTLGIDLKGNNRKCYTFLSQDTASNDTELLEPGPEMSENDLDNFIAVYKSIISEYDLVTLSGSWPIGAPRYSNKELILIAKSLNKKVIIDCSGHNLTQALEAKVFGIHLNADEAISLCHSNDPDKVFEHLQDKVDLIAFTKGKDGLYLSYRGRQVHAKVDIGDVKSAVGSGDCLTAGISLGIIHDFPLEEIAKWSVACGAANCLREELGMLHGADVKSLLNHVEVNSICYEK
ncbi:1-phosphofructokinase [Litoribacter ruber]|nr:1-phosphofructokinase [Litoribacter ruber]